MSAMRAGRRHTDEPLSVLVRNSLERYFEELNGQEPAELYELVVDSRTGAKGASGQTEHERR